MKRCIGSRRRMGVNKCGPLPRRFHFGGPFSTSLFPISITSSTPCSASPLIGAVVGAVIVLFVYGYFAGRKTA
jgi:hypothetical protein